MSNTNKICCGILLGGVILCAVASPAETGVAADGPFTATIREQAYNRSGGVVLSQVVVIAVRSDGSRVRLRTLNKPDAGGSASQRWIVDLTRAEEVWVDDLTESTTTVPLRGSEIEFRFGRSACAGGIAPGTEMILGYQVVRRVHDIIRSPHRVLRQERWLAPGLGCLPLKEVLLIGKTDADVYVSKINEVVSVVPGEPAPALFHKPEGYTERSPSARRSEFNRRYPRVSCPACALDNDRRSDEAYNRQRGAREN